jgi:hypothetical protein
LIARFMTWRTVTPFWLVTVPHLRSFISSLSRYTLGDHAFFEGWDYAQVQADGSTVVLASRWFGS